MYRQATVMSVSCVKRHCSPTTPWDDPGNQAGSVSCSHCARAPSTSYASVSYCTEPTSINNASFSSSHCARDVSIYRNSCRRCTVSNLRWDTFAATSYSLCAASGTVFASNPARTTIASTASSLRCSVRDMGVNLYIHSLWTYGGWWDAAVFSIYVILVSPFSWSLSDVLTTVNWRRGGLFFSCLSSNWEGILIQTYIWLPDNLLAWKHPSSKDSRVFCEPNSTSWTFHNSVLLLVTLIK